MWGVSLIKNFSGVYNKYCTAFETEDRVERLLICRDRSFHNFKVDGKKLFKIHSPSLRNYKINIHQIYFMNKSFDVNYKVQMFLLILRSEFIHHLMKNGNLWTFLLKNYIFYHYLSFKRYFKRKWKSELWWFNYSLSEVASLLLQYSVIFSIRSFWWHVYILSQGSEFL